jgi:hypothetical protein
LGEYGVLCSDRQKRREPLMVNCKLKGNSGYQYAVLDRAALRNLELKNNKIEGPVYPAAGK